MESKKLLIMFWAVALATFSCHGAGHQQAKSNFKLVQARPSFEQKSDIKSAIPSNSAGDQIASKLDQSVDRDALQFTNHKTVEDSYVSTSQLVNIWREQETKFQELEFKIQECRNRDGDYQELAQRVLELETRLNLTEQENIDLRTTIDILHQDDSTAGKFPEKSNRKRTPRELTEILTVNLNSSNDIATNEIVVQNKIRTVAFDAYRSKPFDRKESIVTFDNTSVNVGDGFNVSNGVFTAPYAGIYAFNFHALTRDGSATYVKIQRNDENVGGAYRRHEGEGDEMHENTEADLKAHTSKAEGMLAQSVLLQLEKSDKVSVFAYHGNIRDGGWHYTHFTGYLLF